MEDMGGPGRNPGELPNPRPSSEALDEAIKSAFNTVDYLIVHGGAMKALGLDKDAYNALQKDNSDTSTTTSPASSSRTRLQAFREVALANEGSCALMAVYNSDERSLRLALTGDSRAVFGRRVQSDDGKFVYVAEQLTMDQNATNAEEAARLHAEHPDEPDILKNNRVLGWGPARAFGDGVMKWSRAVQRQLNLRVLGDRPRETCKTPPYFTAEPIITVKEKIEKGDFVVLATDGLWDCLTSEEVVGLVGMWLDKNGIRENLDTRKEVLVAPPPRHPTDDFFEDPRMTLIRHLEASTQVRTAKVNEQPEQSVKPSELPVIFPEGYKDKTGMYKYWRTEKKFVCQDQDTNVASHLARNALGGADADLRDTLMEISPPRSRRFRDDISIIVVFFD
ncbi:protein serine/threonine phosphatase 2C [Agrocybe pediades]|nr:protein serine/threonine phosphatase 2C [Agrocybe pediades]